MRTAVTFSLTYQIASKLISAFRIMNHHLRKQDLRDYRPIWRYFTKGNRCSKRTGRVFDARGKRQNLCEMQHEWYHYLQRKTGTEMRIRLGDDQDYFHLTLPQTIRLDHFEHRSKSVTLNCNWCSQCNPPTIFDQALQLASFGLWNVVSFRGGNRGGKMANRCEHRRTFLPKDHILESMSCFFNLRPSIAHTPSVCGRPTHNGRRSEGK